MTIGCGEQTDITVIDSPKELKVLKTTRIPQNCVSDIIIADSLLVMTAECGKEAVMVYNRNNHEHVLDFGVKGALPSEFKFPFVYKSVDYNPDSICLYDLNRYENKQVNLSAIVNGGNQYVHIKDSPVDRDLFYCIEMSMCNDKIVGVDMIAGVESGLFFIYDPKTQKKKHVDYERYKNNYPNIETLQQAWSGFLFANGELHTIAESFCYLDMVNFYHDNGKLKRSVRFSKIKAPRKAVEFSGIDVREKYFTRDVFGTKDHCWVLRYGDSLEEMRGGKVIEQTLLQLDWNGNLVGSYSMVANTHVIAVDETRRRVYSVARTDDLEYAELVEFQF